MPEECLKLVTKVINFIILNTTTINAYTLTVNGTCGATSFSSTSDDRLKHNVKELQGQLQNAYKRIAELQPNNNKQMELDI